MKIYLEVKDSHKNILRNMLGYQDWIKIKNQNLKGRLRSIKRTKGLVDGKVGFDDEHRGSGDGGFGENVTSLSVENGVDSSHSVLWALDFDKIDLKTNVLPNTIGPERKDRDEIQ